MTLWNKCIKTASELDNKFPKWFENVNLDLLSMEHCTCCIIGQGIPEFDINGVFAPKTFDKDYQREALGWADDRDSEYFDKLNKYWTTLVKQRKEKSKLNQYAHY